MTHDDRVQLAVQLAAGLAANPHDAVVGDSDSELATWAWGALEAIEAEGEKRRKPVKPAQAWDDPEQK